MVILAFGTTAPEESVTRPLTVARMPCAAALIENVETAISAESSMKRRIRCFIGKGFCGDGMPQSNAYRGIATFLSIYLRVSLWRPVNEGNPYQNCFWMIVFIQQSVRGL